MKNPQIEQYKKDAKLFRAVAKEKREEAENIIVGCQVLLDCAKDLDNIVVRLGGKLTPDAKSKPVTHPDLHPLTRCSTPGVLPDNVWSTPKSTTLRLSAILVNRLGFGPDGHYFGTLPKVYQITETSGPNYEPPGALRLYVHAATRGAAMVEAEKMIGAAIQRGAIKQFKFSWTAPWQVN